MKPGEIVLAEGMCVTLLDFQLIFDLIIHNYRYYCRKYQAIGPVVTRYINWITNNRLLYHEDQDKPFLPKRTSLKTVPAEMSIEEFAQAHKYFIFTDLKIKPPEIAASQLIQEQPESVCSLFSQR